MSTTKTTNTSTTPTFTAGQSQLQNLLSSSLGTQIGSGGMTPQLQTEEAGTVGSINNQYAGLSQQLQTSLSGRGFGTSGKAVASQVGLDTSRINAVGGAESSYAGLAQQNLLSSEGLGNQFSFADPGTNSTQTQTTGGFGTVLQNLLQAGGLAFGLATMGGGGGLGGLFGGGGGNMSDDSTGGGYDDYNAGGGFGG